jgi:hypothetical protein
MPTSSVGISNFSKGSAASEEYPYPPDFEAAPDNGPCCRNVSKHSGLQ